MRFLHDDSYGKGLLDTLNIDATAHEDGRGLFYLQALSDSLLKRDVAQPGNAEAATLSVPMSFEYATSIIRHMAQEIPYFRGVFNSIGVFDYTDKASYTIIGSYLKTLTDVEKKSRDQVKEREAQQILWEENQSAPEESNALPAFNTFGMSNDEILASLRRFLNYFLDLNDCKDNWTELASYTESRMAFQGKSVSNLKLKYRVHPLALFGRFGSAAAKLRYEQAIATCVSVVNNRKGESMTSQELAAIDLVPETLDQIERVSHNLMGTLRKHQGLLLDVYLRDKDLAVAKLASTGEFLHQLNLLESPLLANQEIRIAPITPRWAVELNALNPTKYSLKSLTMEPWNADEQWAALELFVACKSLKPEERLVRFVELLDPQSILPEIFRPAVPEQTCLPTPEKLALILKLYTMEGDKMKLVNSFNHPCYYYHALMLPCVQANEALKQHLEALLAKAPNSLPYAMQYVHDMPSASLFVAEEAYKNCNNSIVKSWAAPLKELR